MARVRNRATKKTETASDFENLVRNGIDFLEKAMLQLENEPKYSVINFYTAVEIFLKAPLVHDHWTLTMMARLGRRKKRKSPGGCQGTLDWIEAVTPIPNPFPLRFAQGEGAPEGYFCSSSALTRSSRLARASTSTRSSFATSFLNSSATVQSSTIRIRRSKRGICMR